jgi:hypothetical protein
MKTLLPIAASDALKPDEMMLVAPTHREPWETGQAFAERLVKEGRVVKVRFTLGFD